MNYDYSENILVQESAGHLLADELGWQVELAYNQKNDLSLKKMRGNEVLNIDSTNQVRVENELKSKLYVPMTEEEMLARLKKSREQGIFKDADRVISNMRSKYGL